MSTTTVRAPARLNAARSFSAFVAVAALAGLLGWDAAPASAQGFFDDGYQSPRKRIRNWQHRQPARSRSPRQDDADDGASPKAKPAAGGAKVADAKKPTGPLFLVISIADQHVSVYNHDGLVTRSRISTGMPGHPTPKGIFTILGRERYHHSNIYSGAPMPFMQRVTWSGVAMHLGVVPGYPASHGCIRLPAGFAAQLWGLTKIGERVVISPREVTPSEFEHALLPVPKMQPPIAAANDAANGGAAKVLTDAMPAAGLSQGATAANEPAPAPAASAAPSSAQPALLNPIQYAEQLKGKVAADAAAAAKAVKDTLAAASAKKPEAARAAADLKAAEAAHAAAQSKAEAAAKAFEKAPVASEAVAAAKTAADAALSETAAKLEAVKTAASAKIADWEDAVRLWKKATAESDAATKVARETLRRTSAVSVLVSKKDQRVYVRQGLAALFDAPASVREPDKPLGSHVYIATGLKEDGASLKWSVVSLPAQGAEPESERRAKKRSSRDEKPAAPAASQRSASSPAEALERIEIAPEVRNRISELLWTGGSMIISDQPLSDETSDEGTDLVVKLR